MAFQGLITRFVTVFVCAAAACHRLFAAQPQTLKERAQKAVLTNPEVLSRWHTFKAAEDERDAAFGGFLPRLDLSAGSGRENRDTTTCCKPTIPATRTR